LQGINRPAITGILLVSIAGSGILATSVVAAVVLATEKDPDNRAIMKMGIGLVLVWCVTGGLVMFRAQDGFVTWARQIPVGWRTRFVVLCIIFALLEEALNGNQ
jgi:hypothetical protein